MNIFDFFSLEDEIECYPIETMKYGRGINIQKEVWRAKVLKKGTKNYFMIEFSVDEDMEYHVIKTWTLFEDNILKGEKNIQFFTRKREATHYSDIDQPDLYINEFENNSVLEFIQEIHRSTCFEQLFNQAQFNQDYVVIYENEQENVYDFSDEWLGNLIYHMQDDKVYHFHPSDEEEVLFCPYCSSNKPIDYIQEEGFFMECSVLSKHIETIKKRIKQKKKASKQQLTVSKEEYIAHVHEKHHPFSITYPSKDKREKKIIQTMQQRILQDIQNEKEVDLSYFDIVFQRTETKMSLSLEGVIVDPDYFYKPLIFDQVAVVEKETSGTVHTYINQVMKKKIERTGISFSTEDLETHVQTMKWLFLTNES